MKVMPPTNFTAWLLEERAPERVALREGDRALTYAELEARVRHVAGYVASHAAARSIVPVVGESSIDQVVAYLGVIYAGAVPAPIADSDAVRGIVAETRAQLVLKARREPGDLACVVEFETAAGASIDAVAVPADELCTLMYTSGSTGRPRGVMVSTRNLWANARAILEVTQLRADDHALLCMPLYYCYGASVLHTHLRAGATISLTAGALPEELLAQLVASGATGLPAVPSMIEMLLSRSSIASTPLPHLRYVMTSGGRIPERTVHKLRTLLPAIRVYLRYGITEVTAAASFLPLEHVDERPGSIGRGLPGIPLCVEDGEIVVRGDSVTLGYFGAPEETASAFRDGAFHTGDLATVDADGLVSIVGRTKEFVKTGGHRVAPQEIEAVLLQLTGIESVAVCGVAHPMRGEALVAAVVLAAGVATDEGVLRRHCAAHLPPYKVPARFRIVAALPRTANGKIDRRALAAELTATLP
jgi:long-chain acyl-CoA synthetase